MRPGISRKKQRASLLLLALLAVAAVAVRFFFPDLLQEDFPQEPAPPRAGASQAPVSAGKPLLEVRFLDVGQGDSALIRYTGGNGEWNMLLDTGEYAYADGLTEYLRDLGVEKIDALVCSHPHTDHMGCMARIVQRFEIGAFYMPRVQDGLVPTTSAYEALLNAVSDREGLAATALHAGAAIDCPEDLKIEVLAPRPDAAWEDLNNWSAVIRLTYGEVSFLFTGDAERDTEDCVREDAEACGRELRSTVLKCSHHGSGDGNPSKWLKAVSPKYAVISCGKDNDYGHPHRETLERLEALGAAVYRTDQDGTVLAKSDGKTVAWETGLPSVREKQWD